MTFPSDCRCQYCVYFIQEEKGQFGECRYYPPVMIQDSFLGWISRFPVVSESQYCGKIELVGGE